MSILSRCSSMMVANINALLDRIENPETMVGQIIRDMEAGLAIARSHAASAIAAERGLDRELSRQRLAIDFWQNKARTALAAQREDLARLALASKIEHEALAADLATQHAAALEASNQVRDSLRALESRFAAARRKQRSLIARHRAAQARRQLCCAAGVRLGTDVAAGAKLRRWDERLSELEDEITAQMEVQGVGGVESAFGRWEMEAEIEKELGAMRKEMQ
jgi:phage shock protein A